MDLPEEAPCEPSRPKTKKKRARTAQTTTGTEAELSEAAVNDVLANGAEGQNPVPAKKKKKRKLQAERGSTGTLVGEPAPLEETVMADQKCDMVQKDDNEPPAEGDQVVHKPIKKRKAKSLAKDGIQEPKMASNEPPTSLETRDGAHHGTDVDAPDCDSECLKVCAANLPYWFDKTRIWRHFRRAGDVQHVWLLWDKWSGESRGIAFITFANRSSVKAALEYDGTTLSGNVIRVNLATDKSGDDVQETESSNGWGGGGSWGSENPHYGEKPRPGKGKSKGGKSWPGAAGATGALALADKPQGSLGLMARGLAFSVTEADLKELFAKCGSGPTRVRVLVDKATGESKGKAFIDFADEAALSQAVALNDSQLKGRSLRLEFSRAAG